MVGINAKICQRKGVIIVKRCVIIFDLSIDNLVEQEYCIPQRIIEIILLLMKNEGKRAMWHIMKIIKVGLLREFLM